MKNIKQYRENIIRSVIDSQDYSAVGVKNAIKDLPSSKYFTLVDSEDEAFNLFRINYEVNNEDIYRNTIESFSINFKGIHIDDINPFLQSITYNIKIYEYYIDGGSDDYMYEIDVTEEV